MFYHIAMAKTSRMMLKRAGESEHAQLGLSSLSSEKGGMGEGSPEHQEHCRQG